MAARLEQGVLGQGTRRDNADNIAGDHRFVSALAGGGGVFGLLADGHFEALGYQARQIVFMAVHGHAAHGDVLTQVLAPFGQGDGEGAGRRHRVVEEHLVEVAHAVEQEDVRVLALDGQVLRHHRRDAGLLLGGAGGGGGLGGVLGAGLGQD